MSKTIDNLLSGEHSTENLLTDLLRLGAERILQEATEMYVRGLSTRVIEQTLVDEQGAPVLTRSVTSRIAEELSTGRISFQVAA